MGILKKIAKGLGSAIFILSLISAISVGSLSQFTEYEKIKPLFVELLQVQMESQIPITEISGIQIPEGVETVEVAESDVLYQLLSDACEGRDSADIPLGEAEAGGFGGVSTITINCTEFRELEEQNITATKYLTTLVAESIFDSFYYRKYDCGFLECIRKGDILVIMSAKGNEFFNNIKLTLWLGAAIGAVMIFVFSEGWPERLKSFGWPMTLTGLSYLLMGLAKNVIVESLSVLSGAEQAGVEPTHVIDIFMKPMMDRFLIVLIVGIVLTTSGYILGYYQKRKSRKK